MKNNFLRRERPVFWLFLALYSLFGLTFVFLGILWDDEGWYFGGSWLVANGQLPYQDFFIHHNPVFFYLYAVPQYFFGPNIIVGRLTSWAIMLLIFVLVWRLSKKLGGKTAAFITAGLMVASFFTIYYYTSFTYRVLEAFLMLLFFTVLFSSLKDSVKYPLSTFVLSLVVGVRYPIDIMSGLLILYLLYIAYHKRREKWIIVSSISVAILTLAAIMLPFIVINKDRFFFDTIYFNFMGQKFYEEFEVLERENILNRIIQLLVMLRGVFQNFYAVVAILFGLFLYLVLKSRITKAYIKELITKNQELAFLLTFIILFEIFCLLPRWASFSMRTFTFPAASIVAGVGLANVLAGIKDRITTILLYSLIIGIIIFSPSAPALEARPVIIWEKADINYVFKVADKIKSYTDQDGKILTFSPVLAFQANRELLPGTTMELYNFFPTWDTEKCQKYNVINMSMLLDYISSKSAGAVVLTEQRFFSGLYMSRVLDEYRAEILQVLDENYYLAEKLSYPSNIGWGDVYIYLPRQP
jgi:4-amino-4-deoxy-L-arabinose transferase-like glycosyltransferase